jgi:tetratricopeptide (TPR) repeat protein
MPATWETVSALLAGKEKRKPCRNNFTLDRVLAELEDRGLIGWDRASNRYDLHPIVRSVAWNALDRRTRRGLHRNIQSYFEAIPAPALFAVQSIDELAPAVEICNSLIALERFSDAQEVFRERLDHPTKDLGAAMLRVELLRPLVGDTVDGLPRIDNPEDLEDILAALGNAFGDSGDLSQALHFTNCAHALSLQSPILAGPYTSVLLDISRYSLLAGKIHAAQRAAMEATPQPARKAEIEWVYPTSLAICGMVLAARGSMDKAKVTLQQAVLFVANPFQKADDGWLRRAIAQYKIWCGHGEQIRTLDLNPLSTTDFFVTRDPHEIIRAARLCGQVALSVGNHSEAKQNLQDALNRARAIGFVEEELPALTSLAELHRQQEEYDIAFELLEQAWTPAERGPYRLWHADACNVLTQLHCDVGHRAEAIEAATAAYQLAWCDGPPFAYHYGHAQARRHLQKLAASEPQLPPFDKSNFPPMPEEELNIDNDSDYGTIRVLEPPGAT